MIEVNRTLHIPWHTEAEEAVVKAASYASTDRYTILQSVMTGYEFIHYDEPVANGDYFIRRSEDNGRTWRRCEDWVALEDLGDGRLLKRDMPVFYLDPATGGLFRVYQEYELLQGVVIWDEHSPAGVTRRQFIQYSTDEGLTWSEPEQLVQSGHGYDGIHWADRVWYGRNGAMAWTDSTLTQPDGTVSLPIYMARANDDPVGGPRGNAGVLLGKWTDAGKLQWDLGDYVTLPPTNSATGAEEPGICMLPDGRMYMLIRTRILKGYPELRVPSCRHWCVSEDGGRSWSEPETLLYDDGEIVHSPACFGRVFVSSRNQRMYIITNIADMTSYNCDPRTVIQIAEIEFATLRVIRESVTILEQRHDGQQESIRFSNFAWHEDRRTHRMVLYMTACPGPGSLGDTPRATDVGVVPHCYRYEIKLPG